MNVLITAIGSFSAEAVIGALKKNTNARLVGCDTNPATWIAAAAAVDSFFQIVSAHRCDAYLKIILEISIQEKIDYIIPLTDPEIDVLSAHRPMFEAKGITLCIPDASSVKICRDKYAFFNYFKNDSRINLISTHDAAGPGALPFKFPVIVKPKKGRSSEGLYLIEREADLINRLDSFKECIIQPVYVGDVIAVDYIRNKNTNKQFAVSRKELIRTKNGAGLSVQIFFDEELDEMASHIGEKLAIHGCVNFEFIYCHKKYFLMDINPRFSAGVAFSILAGYDMVTNHFNCFLGKEIQDPIPYPSMIIVRKYIEIITSIQK